SSPAPPHRDLPSFPTRRSSDLVPHQLDRPRRRIAIDVHVEYAHEDRDPSRPGLEIHRLIHHLHVHDLTVRRRTVRSWTCRWWMRSEEHTSELQSRGHLVCRLLL